MVIKVPAPPIDWMGIEPPTTSGGVGVATVAAADCCVDGVNKFVVDATELVTDTTIPLETVVVVAVVVVELVIVVNNVLLLFVVEVIAAVDSPATVIVAVTAAAAAAITDVDTVDTILAEGDDTLLDWVIDTGGPGDWAGGVGGSLFDGCGVAGAGDGVVGGAPRGDSGNCCESSSIEPAAPCA